MKYLCQELNVYYSSNNWDGYMFSFIYKPGDLILGWVFIEWIKEQ